MGQGQGPMGEGRGMRGLNLTEAQQTKLKALHESHQAAFKAKGEAAASAHKALREAMANAATDAKALKTLHDKASAAQFEVVLEHRALRQEVLPLLTPEQKAQFDKHPMGMGMGMGSRGGRGMGPDSGRRMGQGSGHGMGPGSGSGMHADCPGH